MPSHFVRTQERILRELDAIYSSIIFLCLVCLLFIYIKSTRSSPLIYRGSNFTILRVTYKYDDEERELVVGGVVVVQKNLGLSKIPAHRAEVTSRG